MNKIKLNRSQTNKITCASREESDQLGIHPVWSESLLYSQWIPKDTMFLDADSEDWSNWVEMPRLIWVFAVHMGHLIVFVMRQSKWLWKSEIWMYNKKVILQCLVKYWILFALVFILQKPYWTHCRSSNTVSVEWRLVQIKSRILQNTVE